MNRTKPILGAFRVPTDRNWAKQHPRIRTPRPLVDRFNLGNLHPNKEWWRERRIAPATFMGFPDISKAELRGGSLYVEQMDSATLSVIVDKCVVEKIVNEDFWAKFSWRAQQLCPSISSNTDLAYLFRGFSRSGWFDSHLALSLWARIDWLLPSFALADLAVVVQGFYRDAYRNSRYEEKVLSHMLLLVEVRDDWTAEELLQAASSLAYDGDTCCSSTKKRREILWKIAKKLDGMNFSLVSVELIASFLRSFAVLLAGQTFPVVLHQITADLRNSGKLLDGDLATSLLLSLFQTGLAQVEAPLIAQLVPDMYDNIYRLSHAALVHALTLSQLGVIESPTDFSDLVLLRLSREIYKMDPQPVCLVLSQLLRSSGTGGSCVSECLARIASSGLETVSRWVLIDLQSAIEQSTFKSSELHSLAQLLVISVAA